MSIKKHFAVDPPCGVYALGVCEHHVVSGNAGKLCVSLSAQPTPHAERSLHAKRLASRPTPHHPRSARPKSRTTQPGRLTPHAARLTLKLTLQAPAPQRPTLPICCHWPAMPRPSVQAPGEAPSRVALVGVSGRVGSGGVGSGLGTAWLENREPSWRVKRVQLPNQTILGAETF